MFRGTYSYAIVRIMYVYTYVQQKWEASDSAQVVAYVCTYVRTIMLTSAQV